MACLVCVFCVLAAIALPAQTFTTLASFPPSDIGPSGLVQGIDGNFYGTTTQGGNNSDSCGAVFKVTPGGTLTTLYSFCAQTNGTDGQNPAAGVVLATNGNFYGTTENGGDSTNCFGLGCGTVFEISAGGKLTVLHGFDGTDGTGPNGGLVQATSGNFYGTTYFAGAHDNCDEGHGCGTVFEITPAGKLTTLHNFDGPDGENPGAALVQSTNGNFYGTTGFGGTNNSSSCGGPGGRTGDGCGTVFEITPEGKLTVLHSFCAQTGCTDGATPLAGLVQGANGNFYGTTWAGGANDVGTVFEITAGGKLTTLYSFDGADGAGPYAGLVQATDGNFYGVTNGGGSSSECGGGCGTVFKITPSGTLTTLYSLSGKPPEGELPEAGLVQGTDGNFYGTTDVAVFSLSVGLGPFVETLPTFGKEGATVIILGTDLTGATEVRFNGTPAKFTVVSDTEMKTTVPAGAKTGTLEVTTPEGTLKSKLIFRVTPQITSFTPTSGTGGTEVTIIGTGLKQTTQVTFGGAKATAFTVRSDTNVRATVPKGAETGKIEITTRGGSAYSLTSFTVK